MPCTTILAGKKATYDGSTMIARNDDSGSGEYTEKRFIVVEPDDQPDQYISHISHLEIDLPENPLRYTAMPDAVNRKGIWAAAGVNSANVAMTATETITSNERVLGADPLVEYVPADSFCPEKAGGIGEEDIVVITLPYIRSAREGVRRLGSLLEQYGTYEMNGVAFSDVDEVWWLETIGGHHWIARRVPDEAYVAMPNQFGIDSFDLDDALGAQKEYMCSADLREFIQENHLDLSGEGEFNARLAFGSRSDADHVYNTPRAWYMQRCFNPKSTRWDGDDAQYRPDSDDIPWCREPERLITVEDVKYVLSSHYQGTPYDPYASHGDPSMRGMFRPIGINRNDFLALMQIRPYLPENIRSVEWIAFGSNVFNALVPFYANTDTTPDYLANTQARVSTDSFYWSNRLIAALADSQYAPCLPHIERYQEKVQSEGHRLISETDKKFAGGLATLEDLAEANQRVCDMVQKETDDVLGKVLYEVSNRMKNSFSRSDR